ncbi:hypothetical protein Sjap_021276 [Stephania japonica]|uniref:Zinc finger PHD-type domain-containing protein n=1 Tax=Stephania japonica TaxID=461633 RepID=A0AAP0EM35_9MAGN
MVVNGKPQSRRVMKRVSADLYDFMKFPDVETEVPDRRLRGCFRGNIRSFLTKHGRYTAPCSLFPHLMIWQVLLRIGDFVDDRDGSSPAVVTLDVIEEDVTKSRSIYCDQCRVIGWSNHPVCGKRYHFIIQRDSNSIDGNPRSCTRCGYLLQVSDYRSLVAQRIEDTTHLLHGVVHMNGYGHLLRVNGREGGSKFLSGCDIMNFWDRLCNTLGVSGNCDRKMSVMDISKKYGLDYRILHAVTNGHPWYGDWGFEFGAGSFALTLDAYKQAVYNLSNMQLIQAKHIKGPFHLLMKLIHEAHKSSNFGIRKLDSGSLVICPWTRADIERVEQSIIKVLLAVGSSCWVSWRALKGTLCKVASAELIDHCLRELGGKSVPNGTVISRCNADTNSMEYRLNTSNSIAGYGGSAILSCNRPSEFHLLQDLKFLYDSLLNPHTMVTYRSATARELAVGAAMKLLDCKQFVKEYQFVLGAGGDGSVLRFLVNLELSDQPKDFTFPPPEFVDVVEGFRKFEEQQQVKILFGSDASIDVRGRCLGIYGMERFKMERGIDNWTVSCVCGAKDDDGERMMACDSCGTWQHTRCAGIDDLDDVPESVICVRCSDGDVTVKKRLKVEGCDGGNRPSKKKGRSKSSKICQVRASNVVYLHSKVSCSVSGIGEMECVDTVLDTCSSEKFGSYGTEMGVTEKCLKGFEGNIDKESKDETTSDLDTSTVTLSDNFEDTFSLLDTCFLEEPSN